MSRSAKDKRNSPGRQNGETEPFLVGEISGSPVMRGRRQNPEEKSFVIENIPGSPVTRGRGRNSGEQIYLVQDTSGDLATLKASRTTQIRKMDAGAGSRNTSGGNAGKGNDSANRSNGTRDNCRSDVPDVADAPPSYESTIPPNNIGWSQHLTPVIPFPMPQLDHRNDDRTTFSYPPSCPYPPIELSHLAVSHLSVGSPSSKSFGSSPSASPSHGRARSPDAYMHRPPYVARTPPRLQRRAYQNDSAAIPHKESSYKYGGLVLAIFFIIFLMLLSLSVKYVLKHNSFR